MGRLQRIQQTHSVVIVNMIAGLKEGQGRTWTVTIFVAVVALAIAVGGAMAAGSGGGIDPVNLFVEGKLSGNSQEFLGGLIGGTALFAFAAGMASAVNPCGFAMLPAYLGLYLGSNLAEEQRPGPVAAVLRGLVVGGAVSAGFILLFGVVGGAVGLSASFISDLLPWLGLIIGAALVGTGAWMVAGGKLYTGIAARAADRLGNPNTVSLRSFFTFGLSYGTASLSCTLPIFIAVVGIGSASSSFLQVGGQLLPLRLWHGPGNHGDDPRNGHIQGRYGAHDAPGLALHPAHRLCIHGHRRSLHSLLLVDRWTR